MFYLWSSHLQNLQYQLASESNFAQKVTITKMLFRITTVVCWRYLPSFFKFQFPHSFAVLYKASSCLRHIHCCASSGSFLMDVSLLSKHCTQYLERKRLKHVEPCWTMLNHVEPCWTQSQEKLRETSSSPTLPTWSNMYSTYCDLPCSVTVARFPAVFGARRIAFQQHDRVHEETHRNKHTTWCMGHEEMTNTCHGCYMKKCKKTNLVQKMRLQFCVVSL